MEDATRRNHDPILRRDPTKTYPRIVRAEGSCLFDEAGKRYIDAAGGVFVITVGHSAPDVVEAMARQAAEVAFAPTSEFTSDAEQDFARRLLALAPSAYTKAWICTSGSQATETAIKMARVHHLNGGEGARIQVVSRWNSYHGSSLGALALTGHAPRREHFQPYFAPSPKIEPPYCYRCPFNLAQPGCGLACADDLETTIRRIGAANLSAVIVEPVSGGPLGALPSPPGYLKRIREICDRHGLLMIIDEVITGAGRTGLAFGFQHDDVEPDIVTLAKGIGGGFVPIGALLVHERVAKRFAEAGSVFRHGETFTGHAVIAAAGAAVLARIEREGLIERARTIGDRLGARLGRLADHPMVGEVRGVGLLWGIELVADKATRAPYPRARQAADTVTRYAREAGVIVVAGIGCADGVAGDTLCLSPPYVITEDEIEEIATVLEAALDRAYAELSA
jgi:hypothetical protein